MAKKKTKRVEPSIPSGVEQMLLSAFPGGFTLRDEANSIVALAFRNGPIENLHAGKSSELLQRDDLSRITDDEMKEIILFACDKVEQLLMLKETEPDKYRALIMTNAMLYCRRWDR